MSIWNSIYFSSNRLNFLLSNRWLEIQIANITNIILSTLINLLMLCLYKELELILLIPIDSIVIFTFLLFLHFLLLLIYFFSLNLFFLRIWIDLLLFICLIYCLKLLAIISYHTHDFIPVEFYTVKNFHSQQFSLT